MLRIYCASEGYDKEKFIFDNIKGRTLLLVPDQFSLQAERDAFFYLDKRAVTDVNVVDFSSLGRKVIDETAGDEPAMIDKYGRHMLLSAIIRDRSDDLSVFRAMKGKARFTEMVNSFISEMKRSEIGVDMIEEAGEKVTENSFLRYKLEDLSLIYGEYEKAIEGKYVDSEDYISLCAERTAYSDEVASSDVWVYGFDSFTPKNIQMLRAVLSRAKSLNVVLDCDRDAGNDAAHLVADGPEDLFALTGYVRDRLILMAEDAGETSEVVYIADIPGYERHSIWDKGASAVDIASTSNIYAEAERAAAYINGLVRDTGCRYRDIAVVCNDTHVRAGVLRRTFIRWGIPVFIDRKRKVVQHPAVGFVIALMETAASGYRDDSVIRLVKTGMFGIDTKDEELLENYAKQFRIKGSAWKKPFSRRGDSYTEEEVSHLDSIRGHIIEMTEAAKDSMGRYNTASEKIKGLYSFLSGTFHMPERIEELMRIQEESGLEEGASETAQCWNIICDIFDQIINIAGDERISAKELLELMRAGFAEAEIGLVPATADTVIVGTLQRTRMSRIKALVVVGANEGILPLASGDEGVLSDREKDALRELDIEMIKSDEIMRQEERLALYRTLSLPSEKLYMSCSRTDEKGEALRPSEIFELAKDEVLATGGKLMDDLTDEGTSGLIVQGEAMMPYMTDAFRRCMDGGDIDDLWLEAARWYREKDEKTFERIFRGLSFDNTEKRLGDELADALYRGDRRRLEVSASRLEKYSACPFAHFIGYGLRPDEERVYEMGARETGDIYHECIMKLSRKLTDAGRENGGERKRISDPDSAWMTVTYDECREMVEDLLRDEAEGYREGLALSGRNEEYRTGRIAEVCTAAAWALINHVRKGRIKDMYFERPFERGASLPPVTVKVGEKEVLIRGKIDRMDVLETGSGSGEAVRIVDYKTGGASVNRDHIMNGYSLQLMVYMKAAAPEGEKPAGVFLFKLRQVDEDADKKDIKEGREAAEERIRDAYRMEGIVIGDSDVIEAMDTGFETSSDVIPVKRSKGGAGYRKTAGGEIFTPEEFEELSEKVDEQLERICAEICEGRIDIRPKMEKERDINGHYRTSCLYCGYRSICMFDTSFPGCRYERV